MNRTLRFSLLTLCLCPISLWAADAPKNDFDEQNGTGKVTVVTYSLDQAFQKLPSFDFGASFQPLNAIQKAVTDAKKTPETRTALAARLGAVLNDAAATKEAKKFVCRQLSVIGGAAQVPALNTMLLGNDADLAFFARYALERINDPAAGVALRDALGKTKGATLVGVIDSLGALGDASSAPFLKKLTGDPDLTVVAAVYTALGKIYSLESYTVLAQARKLDSPLGIVAQRASLNLADIVWMPNPQRKSVAHSDRDEAAFIYDDVYKSPTSTPALRVAAWRGLYKVHRAGFPQIFQAKPPAGAVVGTADQESAKLLADALKSSDRALSAAAAEAVGELPPDAAEQTIKALPADNQALFLTLLGSQTLPGVRAAALGALKSDSENVRLAALGALANAGDASAILPLSQSAANGSIKEKPVAQYSLSRLRGASIDAEIVKDLDGAPAPVRAVLLQALGARRASAATPALLKAASDTDENVRVAALDALGALSTAADVTHLLELQAKLSAKPGRELTAIEKAIVVAASSGKPETRSDAVLAALNGADVARRASLLRVAGGLGGDKVYAALGAAVKDTDPAVRDAAVRAVAQSSDQAAAPLLLNVAQNAESSLHKTLALRAYVKLAGDTSLKIKDRLAMYQGALAIAPATEKRLVLGGLGTVNSLDALKTVTPLLDDEALRDDASAAAVAIAQSMLNGKVADNAKEPVRTALTKVVEVSKNDAARKQASELLKKL